MGATEVAREHTRFPLIVKVQLTEVRKKAAVRCRRTNLLLVVAQLQVVN